MSIKTLPALGHLVELGLFQWLCLAISVLSLFGGKGESQAENRSTSLSAYFGKGSQSISQCFQRDFHSIRGQNERVSAIFYSLLRNQEIRGLRSPVLNGVNTRHCYCTIPPVPGSPTSSPSYHMSAVTFLRVYNVIYQGGSGNQGCYAILSRLKVTCGILSECKYEDS